MIQQTEIHFNIAKEQVKIYEKNQRKEQAKYLNQFRSEFCDMFTISDWSFYSEKTGWSIQKLYEYAKFSEYDDLTNSVYNLLGSEIDEDDLYAFGY